MMNKEMTKEQAINLLIAYGEENIIARTDVGIAFRMAIKSLEEERPNTVDDYYHRGYQDGLAEGRQSGDCATCLKGIRPKGKWIVQTDDQHDYYECSECGTAIGKDDIRNYCSNCGTDMRESEVEE